MENPYLSQLEKMIVPNNPQLEAAKTAHIAYLTWQEAIAKKKDKRVVLTFRKQFFKNWFDLKNVF